jgi:hypothetical protein
VGVVGGIVDVVLLVMIQRWQKIADHLPTLAAKDPPEMTEGEEVEDEGEDDGDRTESDSEARDFVRLPAARRGERLPRRRALPRKAHGRRRRRLHLQKERGL